MITVQLFPGNLEEDLRRNLNPDAELGTSCIYAVRRRRFITQPGVTRREIETFLLYANGVA